MARDLRIGAASKPRLLRDNPAHVLEQDEEVHGIGRGGKAATEPEAEYTVSAFQ
jgi:hypothetical protein